MLFRARIEYPRPWLAGLLAVVLAACGNERAAFDAGQDAHEAGAREGSASMDASKPPARDAHEDGAADEVSGHDGSMEGGTDSSADARRDAGDNEPAEGFNGVGARSGSRLRVRYHAPIEGEASFLTFYDREQDTECEFLRARDGSLRCLPSEAIVDSEGEDAGYLFTLQPSCTPRVVVGLSTTCSQSARFLSFAKGTSCPNEYTVYATEDGPVPQNGDYCEEASGVDVQRAATGRLIAEEIEPDAWVEGTIVVRDGTQRLREIVIEGSDGSVRRRGTWDSELKVECFPGADENGDLRCLPDTGSRHGPPFSNDDGDPCEGPLSRRALDKCEPDQPYVLDRVGGGTSRFGCKPARIGVWQRGSLVTVDAWLALCDNFLPADEQFHYIGEPIPPERFVPMELVRDDSTRLVVDKWGAPGIEPLIVSAGGRVGSGAQELSLWSDWYDHTLEKSCRFAPTNDGIERCLPRDTEESRGFGSCRDKTLHWFFEPHCTLSGYNPPLRSAYVADRILTE